MQGANDPEEAQMRLNDLTDNYKVTLEPCDARWQAVIEEFDTGNVYQATADTPEEALDEALEALDEVGGATEYDDGDPGDMDGDHESALASAGFGTDEDYGGCGGEDW